MRISIICVCVLTIGSAAVGQSSYPLGDDLTRSEMGRTDRSSYDRSGYASFGITSGVAGFEIDNIARQGYDIDLHATVAKVSPMRVQLNAGVVFYNSAAYASNFDAPYPGYAPQLGPYGDGLYSQPRFSLEFALAYVGSEAVYYFSDGKVRPYVGAGVEAVTWQMNQGYAATLAPSARAGLEVGVSRALSGFGEVRYMYGFPNLLNQYSSSLKYVTSVAFGVSFAPVL